MAPLPIESTNRLVVDYSWRGRSHTVLYRFADPTSLGTIVAALNTFHAAVLSRFYTNWSVLGTGNVYATGQTFSTPVTGITPLNGTGPADPLTHPDSFQVQVLGRATGNRKVSWYYQGFLFSLDPNQRYTGAENVNVQALLAAFQTLRNAGLVAINGQTPALKGYVNFVFNDYLTRRSRG